MRGSVSCKRFAVHVACKAAGEQTGKKEFSMPAKRAAFRPKTAREIAEKVGCSQSTVRRYWALPRDEYLANSITRAKPWEALGMSRATWYRKGKPEPEKAAT